MSARARFVASAAAAGLVLGASSCKRDAREAPSAAAEPEPASARTSAELPSRAAASAAHPEPDKTEEDCCMGKNPCRGKGGCAVPESHACKGQNACAGQGGCRAHCPR